MTTIVVLNINGQTLRVECDGLARDSLLSSNIVLAGCKELDTEDKEGNALDTKVWSVPESLIMSYAVGTKAAPVVQVAPATVIPVVEFTDEQKAEARARRAKHDTAMRAERERRKVLKSAETGKVLPLKKKPGRKPKVAPETAFEMT
jgi:hypothetical protein